MNRLRKFILSHKHTLSSLLMLVLISLPIKTKMYQFIIYIRIILSFNR